MGVSPRVSPYDPCAEICARYEPPNPSSTKHKKVISVALPSRRWSLTRRASLKVHFWKHLHGIQTPKRSQESTTVVRPNMASRLLLQLERSLAKLPSISYLYLIHRRLAYAGAKAINSSKLEKQGYWDDAMKHLDEPIRWREQAFHWPRIILSFVIIYGAIALGIYATYRTYRYVTAASVDSRQSFNPQSAICRIS